jgi:hypothetical protein
LTNCHMQNRPVIAIEGFSLASVLAPALRFG